MESILSRYAHLLVNYCLELKPGEQLYIRTSTLAEPLVREVYRHALRVGAMVETDFAFQGMAKILYEEAKDAQLDQISPFYKKAISDFDAFLVIRAPFNLREDQNCDTEKVKRRSLAFAPVNQLYFERTADRSLKRSLCQFPTLASAQAAAMSLEEYEHFVYNACRLFDDDPEQSWLQVRKEQQHIVDYLNNVNDVHYKGEDVDIKFSVSDRIWINSDGQNNMPSGEVFSAPIENSVNGKIKFNYPCVFRGQDVVGATLWVKEGYVEKWEADQGKKLLDQIFEIDGARYFGEVAVGTNYNIQQATRNILFDEKIGGTIHMAIGQSYKQCGGLNKSTIHWDMIADMKNGGEIWADGERIYENGRFLI